MCESTVSIALLGSSECPRLESSGQKPLNDRHAEDSLVELGSTPQVVDLSQDSTDGDPGIK